MVNVALYLFAAILYGCASAPSPTPPVLTFDDLIPTVNEKIDQLVGQLTQETSLFADKIFAVTEFTDASDKKTAHRTFPWVEG